MTKEEFDSSTFGKDDEIIVRRYFRTEREYIESVDFEQRTINGYKHSQIIEHITTTTQITSNEGITIQN